MKVFLEYPIMTYFIVEKEVPEGLSKEEIINSVTYDDLLDLYSEPELEWMHYKDSINVNDPEVYKPNKFGDCSFTELFSEDEE